MNKRKTLDKAEARKRRDQLIKSAASAELSLIEGVREMRAISGMTQEEFALHRGVSTRVVKGLELGQGNPTVATLNRIGEFFGLEVGFVPIRRPAVATDHHSPSVAARMSERHLPEKGNLWQTHFESSFISHKNALEKSAAARPEEDLVLLVPDQDHRSDLVVMRRDQVEFVQLKNVDLLNDRLKSFEALSEHLTKFDASSRQLKKAADLLEQLEKIDVLSEQLKKAESLSERLKEFEATSGWFEQTELLASRLKAIDELNTKLEKAGLLQDQRKK